MDYETRPGQLKKDFYEIQEAQGPHNSPEQQ